MRWEHLSPGISGGFETIKLMLKQTVAVKWHVNKQQNKMYLYGTNWVKKSSENQKAMRQTFTDLLNLLVVFHASSLTSPSKGGSLRNS